MERITKEKMILDLTKEIKDLKKKTEVMDFLTTIMTDINKELDTNPDDPITTVIKKLADYRMKQAKESIVFFESLIEELSDSPTEVA